MCGICGYISKEPLSAAALREMNDTMYHRGPNDQGIWQQDGQDFSIGLAHRRLSIFDLSELGRQPMVSADGQIVVTFNGEIYNFLELRAELEKSGHTFKSQCDTEVILAAYREWGTSCLARFNGMFAVAIYDLRAERLILARDRMGKKPLYYYFKNGTLIFGSELKALMAHPQFSRDLDGGALYTYFCNKYIVAPQTIFKNTFKLEPGTFVVWQKGEITKEYYWNLLDRFEEISCQAPIVDLQQAKSELKDLLEKAVDYRLAAHVPVGAFLSGGIDSSLMTAIAASRSSGFDTFTIGFHDKERNEAPAAAAIARHLGTKHHEMYMSEEDILAQLTDLPKYYDEPFADSSQLPSMLVSKMAAGQVTVALSGDGGDELFCGYKNYDLLWIARHADICRKLYNFLPGGSALKHHFRAELQAFLNNGDPAYQVQLFGDLWQKQTDSLLAPLLKESAFMKNPGRGKFVHEGCIKTGNWQQKRMLLDMVTYLPDEVLAKMDRASMKYSLEVRNPLLDYRIVEWSFRVSHSLKYRHFNKKYLLKQLAYDYLPEKLLDSPKKGFGVPLKRWLRTVLSDEVARFAAEPLLRKQAIFDPEAVKRLIVAQKQSDSMLYTSLLWSFYVFQRWYDEYMEDITAVRPA